MMIRYQPYRDLLTMRRPAYQLVENSLDRSESPRSGWALPLDVLEQENEYLVRASLPGVRPEDVEITFDKGLLTVRGEMNEKSETEQGRYHLRERRTGVFMRSVVLPDGINADEIQANYQDGVLTLRLPKAEVVKPRRIPVASVSSN